MATFKFAATGYAIDFSNASTNLLFDYDSEKHSKTKLKLFDDGKNYTTFAGKGFTYEVQSGQITDVTGGIVTSLKVVIDGDTAVKISGLNVSARHLYDAVAAGNEAKFVKLLTAGDDTIQGTRLDDIIKGGRGDDKLRGDEGADDLYGGTGEDVFVYKSLKESTDTATGRDTIFDFSGVRGDVIKLEDIDANKTIAGNQVFDFIGEEAFSGQAGELRYEKTASGTYIYADVDGDSKADFSIHIKKAVTLSDDYFIL